MELRKGSGLPVREMVYSFQNFPEFQGRPLLGASSTSSCPGKSGRASLALHFLFKETELTLQSEAGAEKSLGRDVNQGIWGLADQ
jgi:hypothetical protein